MDLSGATDTGDEVEDLSGNALSYEMGTEGMLPGFDDAMRGAAAGETRTFPFTPSNGDWAGVPLTVTATITAVRERELPALDEEFVVMASEFDTVEELREDAKTRVERLKRMEQGQQARERVHESLMEAVEVPVPEGIIAAEVEAHFEDGHEASDEHRAEVEQQAREALKSQFILDKIAESEEVTVGESELSNWLMQQAPRYGMAPDALAQALVESGQVSDGAVGHPSFQSLGPGVGERIGRRTPKARKSILRPWRRNSTRRCRPRRWRNCRHKWPQPRATGSSSGYVAVSAVGEPGLPWVGVIGGSPLGSSY